MHSLVYASRFSARMPREHEEQDHEIGRIIHSSIRNNREAGLTGLLLVHRRAFLQVLEGPNEAIGAAYQRILQDNRHEGARLIGMAPIARRQFGGWNMCARRVSDGDDAIIDALEREHKGDLMELAPDAALVLLGAVRDAQARTMLQAYA